MKKDLNIKIKSVEEVALLRKGGRILATIAAELKRSLKSGMTTREIDDYAEQLIEQHRVRPAFKGYRGFPACVCASINYEVVHGIPSNRVIRDGDIVSIDIGIIFDHYYSDTAFTVGIGKIDPELMRLIEVTEISLKKGIAQARAGNHLSDISHAIQSHVEENGFSVVRDFVGHGIGTALHEDPEIPNFGPPKCGPLLKKGMVLAIEPMVNLGTWETLILDDGWTVITKDHKPSAHFEHSVAITEEGPEILTAC